MGPPFDPRTGERFPFRSAEEAGTRRTGVDHVRETNSLPAMSINRRLSYAQGYLELGMLQEAAAELDGIQPPASESSSVLALRLALFQEQKNWHALRLAAEVFVRREPQEAGGWITWAYASRRDQSLTIAEKILLEAEAVHPREATIQFNLG